MGRRHREERKVLKFVARKCGYRETELGELKVVVTKAEARRRWVQKAREWWGMQSEWEHQLLVMMMDQAVADIQVEADAEFFAQIGMLTNVE